MKKIKFIFLCVYYLFMAWGAFVFLFCFTNNIVLSYSRGPSMEPTLACEDLEYGKKITAAEVDRFDIISFSHDGKILEKRVLGLPGETVTLDHNDLYINGQLTEQPFEFYAVNDYVESYVWSYTLSDDEFFCVGDNRINSDDCRFFGPVKADQIKLKYIAHVSDNKIINFIIEKPVEIASPIFKYASLLKKWIIDNCSLLSF